MYGGDVVVMLSLLSLSLVECVSLRPVDVKGFKGQKEQRERESGQRKVRERREGKRREILFHTQYKHIIYNLRAKRGEQRTRRAIQHCVVHIGVYCRPCPMVSHPSD